MSIPAGVGPPPSQDDEQVQVVHAVDGDRSAVCGAGPVEPVEHGSWADTPDEKRCAYCRVVLGS